MVLKRCARYAFYGGRVSGYIPKPPNLHGNSPDVRGDLLNQLVNLGLAAKDTLRSRRNRQSQRCWLGGMRTGATSVLQNVESFPPRADLPLVYSSPGCNQCNQWRKREACQKDEGATVQPNPNTGVELLTICTGGLHRPLGSSPLLPKKNVGSKRSRLQLANSCFGLCLKDPSLANHRKFAACQRNIGEKAGAGWGGGLGLLKSCHVPCHPHPQQKAKTPTPP